MKILVIAPHMDDEVLGVGGTIAKHLKVGDFVGVCFVCKRAYNHQYIEKLIEEEKESALKAKGILGYDEVGFLDLEDELLDHKIQTVLVPLEKYVYKFSPDILYIPHRGDNNQDHRVVFQASMIVARTFGNHKIERILCYEALSSTEQAAPFVEYAFLPNFYIDIKDFLDKKLEALRCYEREGRAYPHPRSSDAVDILAKKRGTEVGFEAAEAFVLVRGRWG